MNEEILNIKEASEYFKVDRRTLYTLVQNGKIRAFQVGNSYRFKRSDLEEDLAFKNKKQE